MLISPTQSIVANDHRSQISSLSERCLLSLCFDVRSSSRNIHNFQSFLLLPQYFTVGSRVEPCHRAYLSNTFKYQFSTILGVLESSGIFQKDLSVAMWHSFL